MKEELTVYRLNKIWLISDMYGFKSVWSVHGLIWAKPNKGIEKIKLFEEFVFCIVH